MNELKNTLRDVSVEVRSASLGIITHDMEGVRKLQSFRDGLIARFGGAANDTLYPRRNISNFGITGLDDAAVDEIRGMKPVSAVRVMKI